MGRHALPELRERGRYDAAFSHREEQVLIGRSRDE
jgi:hypothetical protein